MARRGGSGGQRDGGHVEWRSSHEREGYGHGGRARGEVANTEQRLFLSRPGAKAGQAGLNTEHGTRGKEHGRGSRLGVGRSRWGRAFGMILLHSTPHGWSCEVPITEGN